MICINPSDKRKYTRVKILQKGQYIKMHFFAISKKYIFLFVNKKCFDFEHINMGNKFQNLGVLPPFLRKLLKVPFFGHSV